jgi:hypothetical protein
VWHNVKKGQNDMKSKNYISYAIGSKRDPDFVVNYELNLCDEMTNIKLYQGMRTDFLYEDESSQNKSISMIWPEFLDKQGNVIESTG